MKTVLTFTCDTEHSNGFFYEPIARSVHRTSSNRIALTRASVSRSRHGTAQQHYGHTKPTYTLLCNLWYTHAITRAYPAHTCIPRAQFVVLHAHLCERSARACLSVRIFKLHLRCVPHVVRYLPFTPIA
jgi:hypothetical protein